MPARAKYFGNAVKLDGVTVQIIPNSSVTVYQPGTLTPISGSALFSTVVGGPALGNPFTTDAHGNVAFYMDAPQRVKLVLYGVGVGPLVIDYEPVLPDPSELLVNGQTAAASLAGGLAVTRNADAFAVTIQNTHASAKSLQLLDEDGTSFFQAKKSTGGNNVFAVSDTTTNVPDTSQVFTEKTLGVHYVNLDSIMIATGTGGASVQDAGAIRGVGYQLNSGGNALIRGVEAHAIRQAPASHSGTAGTWCIECALVCNVAGNTLDQSVGIYVNSTSTSVRGDCGIILTGGDLGSGGWEHFIRCMDNNRTTALIDLSKTGVVSCSGVVPRTASSYTSGSITFPWAGVISVAYNSSVPGTEASPQFNQHGFGSAGLYVFQNSQTGLTLGASDYANLKTTGLEVAKLSSAGTGFRAGSGNYSWTADTDTYLGRPGNDNIEIVTAGTRRMLINVGMQLGVPTGGDRGTGTLNVAGGVYLNNSAYTNPDAALEHYFTGQIVRHAESPSAAGYTGRMALADVREYARTHWQLPRVADQREVFGRTDILLEKVEELFSHLWEMDDRLRAVEAA